MASSRSTNTTEEILQRVLADLSQAKASVDGMQWLEGIVKVETTVLQVLEQGRAQQMQQQMQQNPMANMQGAAQMGGAPGGMAPPPGLLGMGPQGMPGSPGPGIPGLRQTTPGAPDELRRILNAGPG